MIIFTIRFRRFEQARSFRKNFIRKVFASCMNDTMRHHQKLNLLFLSVYIQLFNFQCRGSKNRWFYEKFGEFSTIIFNCFSFYRFSIFFKSKFNLFMLFCSFYCLLRANFSCQFFSTTTEQKENCGKFNIIKYRKKSRFHFFSVSADGKKGSYLHKKLCNSMK